MEMRDGAERVCEAAGRAKGVGKDGGWEIKATGWAELGLTNTVSKERLTVETNKTIFLLFINKHLRKLTAALYKFIHAYSTNNCWGLTNGLISRATGHIIVLYLTIWLGPIKTNLI